MVLLVLGVLFSLEKEEEPLPSAPEEEAGLQGLLPKPGPAHLLTLAIRSSRSPSMALGETSKVATKVI